MKKFKILCFVVTALLAFAACSNDGDEITVPRNLDPYEGNSNDEGSTESRILRETQAVASIGAIFWGIDRRGKGRD